MTPTTVYLILLAAILVGVGGVVLYSMRGRGGGKSAKAAPRKGGRTTLKGGKSAAGRATSKMSASGSLAPAPAKAKSATKAMPADERKYLSAKKRFTKTIDKRIFREAEIGEQLRRNRDMVLTWYDQKGRVEKMRYLARDGRTACKVCSGRNGKEYPLLKPDVIAQVLPPSHNDLKGRKECQCHVTAVVAGEAQVART